MPRTRRQDLLMSGKAGTPSCDPSPDPPKPRGSYPIYSPLDRAKQEIRLVQIKPSATNDVLSCTLSVVSLHLTPEYTALSYVWGDPTITTTIIVDDHQFQATKNLVNALTRVRCEYSHDPKLFLWVDALCINQQDDQERSSQVDVGFRWIKVIAREVFHACFTPATAKLFESFPETSLEDIVEASNERGEPRNLTRWLENYPSLHQKDYEGILLNTTWRSVLAVFSNEYWRRVWIFQELLLAQSSFFLAYERNVSISELCLVADWILLVASREIPHPQFLSQSLVVELKLYIGLAQSAALCYRLSRFRGAVLHYHKMDTLLRGAFISQILSATFDMEATDSRDHVYGCLSVMDASTEIIPDYSQSVGSIYCQWTRWLAATAGNLDVIIMAGIGASREDAYRLPSWAPDWHLPSHNAKWTAYPAGANIGLRPISRYNFQITKKINAFHAEGINIAIISAVECFPNNLVELASKPSIFIAAYKALRSHVHPTGEPPLQIFCRTLARDRGFRGLEREHCPESVLNLAADITAWTLDLQNSTVLQQLELCPGTATLELLKRDFFPPLDIVQFSGYKSRKTLSDDEVFKLLPILDHLTDSSLFWTAEG